MYIKLNENDGFEQSLYLYKHVNIAPANIVLAFGEPTWKANSSNSGDGKVSREYFFKDSEGYITGIWDYKSTELYDNSLPTPTQFWKSNNLEILSIVGADNEKKNEAFMQWVFNKVKDA